MRLHTFLVTTRHFVRGRPAYNLHEIRAVHERHAASIYLRSRHHFTTEAAITKITKMLEQKSQTISNKLVRR
jgi:hypothetical protein